MQWSRAFSLMFDAALRLMCGGVPTAPNKASLLTSRCKRLGRAAGSGQWWEVANNGPPSDRPTYLPSPDRKVGTQHVWGQLITSVKYLRIV
jgi:hypothetical protein